MMARSESLPFVVHDGEEQTYDSMCITVIVESDSDTQTDPSADVNNESLVDISTESQKMSDLKTIMTIIKGNMGTGVLAMPFAISCAGLVVGPILLILMGIIALFCTHLLVRASREQLRRAEAEGQSNLDMTYAQLMGWAMYTAHPSLRGWPTTWGKRFVNMLLLMSQLGFCSVYILFVAENIKEVVQYQVSRSPPLWVYQLCTAVPLLFYTQITDLKKLSPCFILANILTVTSLATLFLNFFSGHLPDVRERPAFAGWSRMPIFFSTAIFSFEGISLVLPLAKHVRNRGLFSASYGMLTFSLTFVVSLYTAMGFFGFLAYGPHTLASITLNLPFRPWYYSLVRPAFALVIFISYSLQLHVPVRITMIWLKIKSKCEGDERQNASNKAETIVRVFYVLVTLMMAIVIPQLDLLISFVGAFASFFLAFILPALIYLLTASTQPQRPRVVTIVCLVFIIALGLLGFVVGTYTSVLDIMHALF